MRTLSMLLTAASRAAHGHGTIRAPPSLSENQDIQCKEVEVPMPTTWILIADGARARLLEQDSKSRHFNPTAEQEFFGSRAQSKEIGSDDRGRSFDSTGRGQPGDVGGQRHGMEPRTDPQRYAEYAFARDLSDHLEKAANEHRFDRLILVAAPKALGDLRRMLPKSMREKIVAEIDKELTNVPTRDLGKHLDAHLSP
jgi:protein required for attachment to host cells